MERYCSDCADNYRRVLERVQKAALKSGRAEDAVQLVAVTKTVDAPAIAAVLQAGATLIGENRVQELQQKHDALSLYPHEAHMIGHLQSNKAKYLPKLVTMVQSIDSEKLAEAVDKAFEKAGKVARVLLEVNIGGEESKSGVAPEKLEQLAFAVAQFSHLQIEGLMCVPPAVEGPALYGYFDHMNKLFIDMKDKKIHNTNVKTLSMGMSGDFEAAIAAGANMVRVGTGIFGARPTHTSG